MKKILFLSLLCCVLFTHTMEDKKKNNLSTKQKEDLLRKQENREDFLAIATFKKTHYGKQHSYPPKHLGTIQE